MPPFRFFFLMFYFLLLTHFVAQLINKAENMMKENKNEENK